MLNTLFELYGQDLESKLASLDSNPVEAQALKLWSATEDLYALKVWVEEPSGWQIRGMIPGGGMGARVVRLDVSRVKGATQPSGIPRRFIRSIGGKFRRPLLLNKIGYLHLLGYLLSAACVEF